MKGAHRPMYDELTLENGLRIVGERIPHFRSVSVGIWVAAGSQYEAQSENGISHFLEHMLFKGTQRRSARQIAEEMDAVGGQLNAFTSKECTCYYAKVVDEHLELAVDLLSDLVCHSTFDEGELKKEKGVILEEISMVEDAPEDLVHELLMQAQLGDQPLARPILGSAANIRAFSRDDLMGYWKRMYRPECTVLSIAGNYDWDRLVEMIRSHLGEWPGAGARQPQAEVQPPKLTVIRREKDIEQLHLCLGYPGVAQGNDEVYPLSIFNGVFGGAMSSRLFQKIREESGMAYSVYSYPSSYMGLGVFAIYAGTSQEHAQQVVEMIKQEVDRIYREGISRSEFEQAREQLKGSYILGLESTSSRMSSLGRRKLLLGNTQTESEVLDKVNAITYDQVHQVIHQVLGANCAAALVGRGADGVDLSPFGL